MSSSHTTAGLIGIDVRVSKVESLLNMESPDVVIVGIWGMGGIGKTTIAKAVCSKVRSRFDGIFFANFRHQSDLETKFLKRLLGQEILNMGFLNFRDSFVRDRLRRKKVFIVLDDVDTSKSLGGWRDLLHGPNSSFGPGSKVLITSRDKQVLKNVVDETYEFVALNYKESLKLISSEALKNCIPTIDHRHMIAKIAWHVQGNPLALKVLGSSLYGKSIKEWRSASNKLAQDPQIKNALIISYESLDSEQKSIFLDIAHFFIGRKQDEATGILDCLYGPSVTFDISTLIDKCLITTYNVFDDFDKRLKMHDLLREMAFNIVREESDFPGERSRLCHPPDVVQVLKENKGTQKIKGISLDMSELSRDVQLKSNAFAMMDGLRFLDFYHLGSFEEDKMILPPTGLEDLPNELRYLRWDGFPLKSLPPSFRAEHLVELHLSKSMLVKLWTGVKDVGYLRKINLSSSDYLTELPDLSMAKNLVCLRLKYCPLLTEVPTSLQYLDKLEEIDVDFCENLRSFPMLYSKVLRVLTTYRCLDLTTCPTISQNMKILRLPRTSIKEVPQSVTGKLQVLDLSDCSEMTKFPEISGDIRRLSLRGTAIKEVPSSIQFLIRLPGLDMSGCSKLESFPEITVPMESLEFLDLSGTGIKEIPSISFKHMTSLKRLYLCGMPLKELPSSIQFLTRLEELHMSGCSELESFPEITVPMKSLQVLKLSKTGIKEIPSISFKNMISLMSLYLDGTPIKALPELPSSLFYLMAHDCALETVTPIINIYTFFHFTNCFKLDQKPLVEALHLKIQSGMESPRGIIQMVLPGSEIPEWFGDKGIGSSLTIQLPSNCHQLKGIAFCLVFLLPLPSRDFDYRSSFHIYVDCHVKSKNGEHDGDDEVLFASKKSHCVSFALRTCASNHMVLQYHRELVYHLGKYSGNEVTFKFYRREMKYMAGEGGHEILRQIQSPNFELKSCGVYLDFDENLPADKGYKRKFWEI